MKKFTTTVLALTMAFGLTTTVMHAQQGVAGDWEITLETPQGQQTVNLSLKQDAGKLTGELTSPLGAVPVTGTSSGDDASFAANIDAQGMAIQLTFTAKAVGDTFNGQVKLADFGEFPFTGKRAAAKAAAASAPAAAAAAPAAGGAAGDLSGNWNVVLSITGLGEIPVTATLKQDGDKLTGSLTSPMGEVPVAGTFSGGAIKLEFSADTPQGKIPVTMTGERSGTGLKGKAALTGMGEAEWTATRAQ